MGSEQKRLMMAEQQIPSVPVLPVVPASFGESGISTFPHPGVNGGSTWASLSSKMGGDNGKPLMWL